MHLYYRPHRGWQEIGPKYARWLYARMSRDWGTVPHPHEGCKLVYFPVFSTQTIVVL